MADSDDPKAESSAEKAYAAAAEAISELDAAEVAPEPEPEPKIEDGAEPVEFPAKPKRAPKPPVVAADEPAAAVPAPEAKPVAAPPAKVRRPRAAAKPVKPAKPVAKIAAKRAAAKAATAKVRKPAPQKIKTAPKAAPKIAKAGARAAPKLPFITQLKEFPMDVTASIKDAASGAQEKAKEAFTKGSALAGEYGEFAKGNVEAFVESGKILASGLQDLGNKFIADSKTAFETATTDVKALTSVKSPSEFFQFQTDLLRRNFDNAVSYSTKTGEAVLKLTGDVIKPISGRVSLAVDKVKAAA